MDPPPPLSITLMTVSLVIAQYSWQRRTAKFPQRRECRSGWPSVLSGTCPQAHRPPHSLSFRFALPGFRSMLSRVASGIEVPEPGHQNPCIANDTPRPIASTRRYRQDSRGRAAGERQGILEDLVEARSVASSVSPLERLARSMLYAFHPGSDDRPVSCSAAKRCLAPLTEERHVLRQPR
jgi:hypothetical protein